MWVNTNKGVLLLFWTRILFILSTLLLLFCLWAPLLFACLTCQQHIALGASFSRIPAADVRPLPCVRGGRFFLFFVVFFFLPGSVKFRRVHEYGSSLSSSGMGQPCSPTINFTPTLEINRHKHYCIHLVCVCVCVCAILGCKISKACLSIHPPLPWLLRVA